MRFLLSVAFLLFLRLSTSSYTITSSSSLYYIGEQQNNPCKELYTSYGNALSSAEKIFEFHGTHPELSKFNGTDYMMDLHSCWNMPKLHMCYRLANKYHRDQFRLWHPKDHADLRTLDCKYRISLFRSELSRDNDVVFSFIIHQTECISNIPDLIGGTTFSIFAYSELYLLSCSSIDNYNNTYLVSCSFPLLHQSILNSFFAGLTSDTNNISNSGSSSGSSSSGSSNNWRKSVGLHCIKLIALVEYEHFDGYSEVLLDWSNKYPPSKTLISNGKEFCASFAPSMIASSAAKFDGDMVKSAGLGMVTTTTSDVIHFYSGLWIYSQIVLNEISNLKSADLSLFIHDRSRFFSNYDFYLQEGPISNYSELHYEMPLLSSLSLNKAAYEQLYSFLPTVSYIPIQNILTSSTTTTTTAADATTTAYNDKSIDRKSSSPKSSHMRGIFTPPKYINYTSDTIAATHDFHFIGMSHIRYVYDAILEYFLGKEVLIDKVRKHDHMRFRNFIFNGTGIAKDQAFLLMDICRKREQISAKGREEELSQLTILIHVGAWDLSLVSLRMLLKYSLTGPAWLGVLLDILSGKTKCPLLKHVVWVTMVPYPMCHDTRELKCNNDRSYRANSAIAAANSDFLNHILENHKSKDILFSVIDAYSFIFTRLILNEDFEKTCTNHFLCRRDSYYNTLHTIGGNALMQSILYAFNRSIT